MRKRRKPHHRMKKNHKLVKKTLGVMIAVAGAVIVIHMTPIAVWYGIGGLLIVAMIIYLIL